MVKKPTANAGDIRDMSSVFGLGRAPVEGHGKTIGMEIYMYIYIYAVLCLVAQSCPTLCDPMDCM